MEFTLERTIEVLSATPTVINSLLGDLSPEWITAGTTESWGPVEIIGHLIHCEEADWMPRARLILEHGESKPFEPLDRFAQFANDGKAVDELIVAFTAARRENLEVLQKMGLSDRVLDTAGTHPDLGRVTLRQLLATWAVHDLTHIRQLATVIAKRYDQQVGPWKEYLSILK